MRSTFAAARSLTSILSQTRNAVSTSTIASSSYASAIGSSVTASSSLFSLSSFTPFFSHSIRHTQSATAFRFKKQKEHITRAARGWKHLKTHAGCKKRFRFVGRFAAVSKHPGKVRRRNWHRQMDRPDWLNENYFRFDRIERYVRNLFYGWDPKYASAIEIGIFARAQRICTIAVADGSKRWDTLCWPPDISFIQPFCWSPFYFSSSLF